MVSWPTGSALNCCMCNCHFCCYNSSGSVAVLLWYGVIVPVMNSQRAIAVALQAGWRPSSNTRCVTISNQARGLGNRTFGMPDCKCGHTPWYYTVMQMPGTQWAPKSAVQFTGTTTSTGTLIRTWTLVTANRQTATADTSLGTMHITCHRHIRTTLFFYISCSLRRL